MMSIVFKDAPLRRRSGITLWRQIADEIRADILHGLATSDGRLPPEQALAERFAVNRHTIRAAIGSLRREGVLRAEQGRGTFVNRIGRLTYPLSRRTRFSAGFRSQGKFGSSLVGSSIGRGPPRAAAALGLPPRTRLLRLDTVGEVDGLPVSRSNSWFEAARFKGLARAYRQTGSITAALTMLGIDDYVRVSTVIDARHADEGDRSQLKLEPGALVLVTRAVNAMVSGSVFQYSETAFVADRVELRVDHAASGD